MLRRAFFDVLHCQAPPVMASASTATSAASERPASSIGRRRCWALRSRRAPWEPSAADARRVRPRSRRREAGGASAGSGSSGWARLRSGSGRLRGREVRRRGRAGRPRCRSPGCPARRPLRSARPRQPAATWWWRGRSEVGAPILAIRSATVSAPLAWQPASFGLGWFRVGRRRSVRSARPATGAGCGRPAARRIAPTARRPPADRADVARWPSWWRRVRPDGQEWRRARRHSCPTGLRSSRELSCKL